MVGCCLLLSLSQEETICGDLIWKHGGYVDGFAEAEIGIIVRCKLQAHSGRTTRTKAMCSQEVAERTSDMFSPNPYRHYVFQTGWKAGWYLAECMYALWDIFARPIQF